MTHSESLARQLVDDTARAIRDEYERLPDGTVPEFTEVHEWHGEARKALGAALDILRREHTAGLMPYNPGAYLNELIEKVRGLS